jgi:hypothetical protein
MSIVIMLMIGAWIGTLSLICVCGLRESGKLLKMREGMESRLDSSVADAVLVREEIMGREVAQPWLRS